MRKFLCLLATLLFLPCASAESDCCCGQSACSCFIQLGDEGMAVEAIQHALINAGYLAPDQNASAFDQVTRQGVISFQEAHDLSPTGMMNDETLTLLLWNMTPEELDQAMPFSNGRFIWIPTDGGKKRHVQSTCSKMLDPRLVSVRNAQQMGMDPCGRCNQNGSKE